MGSIVAAGFYKLIKILEYETANPDQDAAERAAKPKTSQHGQEKTDHNNDQPFVANVVPPDSSHSSHTYGDFADRSESMSRPATATRKPSNAVHSPAMGTTDDAYAGLSEGGLHSGQNTAAHEANESPGMVVNDGLAQSVVRRLGRGSSYAA